MLIFFDINKYIQLSIKLQTLRKLIVIIRKEYIYDIIEFDTLQQE